MDAERQRIYAAEHALRKIADRDKTPEQIAEMRRLLDLIARDRTPAEESPFSIRWVAPADLAAMPDAIAPVSGLRCRECGANAREANPLHAWTIEDGATYCPTCRPTGDVR